METYKTSVLVVGGGPSGLAAAVSCSRLGIKTTLIERFGIVGGNLTLGHVAPIMGDVSHGTIVDEVINLLNLKWDVAHDIEKTKIALSNWLANEKVDLFLQTVAIGTIMEGNTIKGVIANNPSGNFQIDADIIIDATGNGSVAAFAGADYEIGRTKDGLTQPTTIMFTISNISPLQKIECRHEEDDTILPEGSYLGLCRKASLTGELPKNVNIVRLYRCEKPDERVVNATQANGVNGLDGQQLAKAENILRQQEEMIFNFLKKHVPGFEDSQIKKSADTVGVRETRRIIGEYQLTDIDLMNGQRFNDVMVHKANFAIDIHNPSGPGQSESDGCPRHPKPYDIPYRCFVPKKIDNLFVTGRCISGTHEAHASYRVMRICMAMGQSIGTAAGLCLKEKQIPRTLDYRKVQEALMAVGVDLFSE